MYDFALAHRPPARQPARDPAAGEDRPAARTWTRSSSPPGPAGWPTSAASPPAATYNSLRGALLGSLLRSPDYSLADAVRSVPRHHRVPGRAAARTRQHGPGRHHAALDVPIVLAQGRLDQVAPGEATQRFYDSLTAPSKQLVWFENSAHTPQYDEPEKFRRLLLDVKATHLTSDLRCPRRTSDTGTFTERAWAIYLSAAAVVERGSCGPRPPGQRNRWATRRPPLRRVGVLASFGTDRDERSRLLRRNYRSTSSTGCLCWTRVCSPL